MVHDIENVINSYEAEEERIVNVLSRKLEQVCQSQTSFTVLFLAGANAVVYSFERRSLSWNTFWRQRLRHMVIVIGITESTMHRDMAIPSSRNPPSTRLLVVVVAPHTTLTTKTTAFPVVPFNNTIPKSLTLDYLR
jgi:hypothetical protein